MKKIILIIIVTLTFLNGAWLFAEQPYSVSLVQLIATPEKYNGKFVRVNGYLHVKFEDSALYFSKDHADRIDARNAIWMSYAENGKLQLQPKHKAGIINFDCEWVFVEGIFVYESEHGHGHMSLFSGELKNVTRVVKQIQWYNGKKELKR